MSPYPLRGGRQNGIVSETDVAHTLMARDYKGPGNQDGTMVCYKISEDENAEK